MIASDFYGIVVSVVFVIFVSWRVFFVKQATASEHELVIDQQELFYSELEQLEYDLHAGKIDSETYSFEREKLLQKIAEPVR